MQKQGEYFDRLDAIGKRKRDLEEKSDQLMAESASKRQVAAFYDQVGFSTVPDVVNVDDSSTMPSNSTTPSAISFSKATLKEKPRDSSPRDSSPRDSSPRDSSPQQSTQSSTHSSASRSVLLLGQLTPDDAHVDSSQDCSQETATICPTQSQADDDQMPPLPAARPLPASASARLSTLNVSRCTRLMMEQAQLNHENAHEYYAGEEGDDDI